MRPRGHYVIAVFAACLAAAASLAQQSPGHDIDQKQLCLSCHELDDSRVTHAPVEAGECSACHNPHVARYAALLRERPGPLCARCHEDVTQRLQRPTVHPPVREQKCAACHQPHGSAHAGLLVDAPERLCQRCHEGIDDWRSRAVQHAPFAAGDCDACHDPHSTEAPHLLLAEGAALCGSCHELDASLRRQHAGQPVEQAACGQCHEPHASAKPGLFREASHEPFASGDCSTCHPGPGAAEPFATLAPIDELCGTCHAGSVERARAAPFPHLSGASCVSCHNPHTGEGALLAADQQTVCTRCHDPGGASTGGETRHVSHAGLECTTCHTPHGGERPLLFAAETTELCGSCHSHEHGAAHPLGEGSRDPRTGVPMDCRSCHGIHRAEGAMYLFETDVRMLCVGCHKDMARR